MTFSLFAQQINVKGRVIGATDNEAVIGAVVVVVGTNNATMTDVNGTYSLNGVPANGQLQFSYSGYKQQVVAVNNRTTIDVTMEDDVQNIDEVVVVGYGTVKRSDLTSSISTVKGDDLKVTSSGNAMNSLQGKAAGVQITTAGGPGSTPRVVIRGVTTVNGSDPLYVVDGMPVSGNINFLSQDDIESIEILKDASASAIYGTRGSNGVILVTTKKGSQGAIKFSLSANVGVQTLEKPNMAKASEYEKVFKTRYTNDGSVPVWNGKNDITDAEGTDWWNEVVKPIALTQDYNLSFTGGTEKLLYSGSIGYYNQDANFSYGNWQRVTARFNTVYKVNKIVEFGVDLAPRFEKWNDTPNLFNDAMRMDPTTPVMRPEEEWTDNYFSNFSRSHNSQVWNPVANLARLTANSQEYGLMMNPYISVKPLKGLTIRSQFGIDARFRLSDNFTPSFFIDNLEQQQLSYVSRTSNQWVNWNWMNTVNYENSFGKHNLNLMGGFTMEEFANYWVSGSRENTPSNIPNLQFVNAGTLNQKSGGSNGFSSLISYLARAMYNYDNRYYITASVRVDGSSKFPSGSKYATFPAVSLAWRISNEKFMQNQNVVSNLKLRLGWGRVGNQNIDSDAYLTLIGTGDYVFGSSADRNLGTAVSTVGNSMLRWETVEDFNIGVDAGFLNNRLNVTADIYQKTSKDMLLKKANLSILGYPMWNGEMWTNIGSMQARGWELSASWRDNVGDFSYQIGLIFSGVENKALKLVDGSPILGWEYYGNYITRNEEGGQISRFYGYVADGLFQNQKEINAHTGENGSILQPNAKPGDIRYVDLNNDGVIDDKDKTYLGNALPKFTVGLNANFAYKNFELIANFYGTFGNQVFNLTNNLYSGEGGVNVFAGTYDKAWNGEGTSNFIPRLSVNDANKNYQTVSSFYIEDGSYFRCKLLQIAYNIPRKPASKVGLRVSLSAQNLFTITNYSGMDPERAQMGGGIMSAGIDNVGYPNPRTFLLGLNFTF